MLFGWAFDLPVLETLHPSLAAMKPNNALLFILLGGALSSSVGPEARPGLRRVLAAAVVAVATATLAESLLGTSFGIDELLFRDRSSSAQGLAAGRMPPVVSLNFILLGLALLARRPDAPDTRLARAAVVAAGLSSFVALAGYLFSVRSLYTVGPFTSTGLHTVLCFLVACVAFMAARPREGLMAVATSQSAAGVLLRRVLPLAVLGAFVLDWLQLWGENHQLFDSPFRLAVLTVGDVLLLSGVLSTAAARLHLSDVELGASEDRYRLMVEAIRGYGIFTLSPAGRVATWNAGAERFTGYPACEVLGQPVSIFYTKEGIATGKPARELEIAEREGRCEVEDWRLNRDGTRFWANVVSTAIFDSDNRFIGLVQVVRDITARHREEEQRKRDEREREELILQKKAAEQLRERSRFFELSLDMVCIANTRGRFLQINPAFSKTLGYSTQELLERPVLDFVYPEDREETQREFDKLAHGTATLDFTARYLCKDGRPRWFQWRAISEPDGSIYAVARDVTGDRELLDALQRQQASLSSSLKEREVLLQEVHHRVKNNLQVISSLINLQLLQLEDDQARRALEECRTRIETIALIHEKLYQAHDYARIPFSEYVKNLADYILRASGVSPGSVTLQVDSDEVLLPVDRAIPCALMLNELITNSLKHAFPGGRLGQIHVQLRRSNGHVQLAVADDGVGIPAGFDPQKSSSLGMQLVTTLNEQLDGHMEIMRGAGTTFQIEFSVEERA